jgi:hypothetical protein
MRIALGGLCRRMARSALRDVPAVAGRAHYLVADTMVPTAINVTACSFRATSPRAGVVGWQGHMCDTNRNASTGRKCYAGSSRGQPHLEAEP